MLNSQEIKQLEKEWVKYKVKQHSKKAVFAITLISMATTGYYFYNSKNLSLPILAGKTVNEKDTSKKTSDKNDKKQNIAENKIQTPIQTSDKKTEIKDKKPLLALDTKFLENIEKRLEKEAKEQKIKKSPTQKRSFQKEIEKEVLTQKKQEKKKIKIVSKQINTLTFLKKKFEATKDIKYALMVASHYYKKRDYKNSLKWAIRANEIDSSNEESWIIFAKSKLKLGRKKEAINALKLYLKNRDSQNVLNVLQKIKRGNLNG